MMHSTTVSNFTKISLGFFVFLLCVLAAFAANAQPETLASIDDLVKSGELNDHRMAYHFDSIIALGIILLAWLVAAMLNHAAPGIRTVGTLLSAVACFIVVAWFLFVLQTGFLENPRPALFPTDSIKPATLWIQTGLSLLSGLFLLAATVWQSRRSDQLALASKNTAQVFGRTSRVLHWTTAILFLSLIPMGIFTSMIPEDASFRQGYYVVHKTIGILVFVLLLIRIIWNCMSKRPGLDPSLKTWERRMAKFAHGALYFLLFALPISGFVMSTYGGKLSHFFIWDLPLFWEADSEKIKLAGLLHKVVLPFLCYAIIASHILGALKHRFVDNHENSLRRMVS